MNFRPFWIGLGGLVVGVVQILFMAAGAISYKNPWPMCVWMAVCVGFVVFGRR